MKTKAKNRRRKPTPTTCPCTSGERYEVCCQPVHLGTQQPTHAEAVVRARFAAFALRLPDFLFQTLHSAHDDHAMGASAFAEQFLRASGAAKYRKLTILDQAEPDAHGVARVLFSADIQQLHLDRSFVEQSDFVQENGSWKYLLGYAQPRKTLSHGLADMRLDHWRCGHDHHH